MIVVMCLKQQVWGYNKLAMREMTETLRLSQTIGLKHNPRAHAIHLKNP